MKSKLRKNIVPLIILTLAAATIYGLPYFRYNYWETFKVVYELNEQQMANLQTAYGLVGLSAYFVGGILADKFSAKKLLIFSFIGTALGGFYLLTIPGYYGVLFVHAFWGITTLMTFWPAFIKAIRGLGNEDEQGRVFGIMEGARGVFGMILATIPIAIFAYYEAAQRIETGMLRVVLFYSVALVVVGILTFFFLKEPKEENSKAKTAKVKGDTMRIFKSVIRKPSLWLICGIVFTSYSMNIAFYTFNQYAENFFLMTAAAAATITVAAQYIRPLAAPAAGFLGNKIGISKTVIIGFLFMFVGTAGVILLDPSPSMVMAFRMSTMIIFFGMYAVQGNHFALLTEGGITKEETGTAVGIISTIGYLPEIIGSQIYLWFGKTFGETTTVNGVTDVVHTVQSSKLFYGYLCLLFIIGIIFALIFMKLYLKKDKSTPDSA